MGDGKNEENKEFQNAIRNYIFYILIIAIAVVLLALIEKHLKGFYLGIFLLFGINAIICLGVTITNSYANIFSLGFGGIMLFSAMFPFILLFLSSIKLLSCSSRLGWKQHSYHLY
jgi:magnesium-transporting ATPase (P-type)